jgi:hypothetical protein
LANTREGAACCETPALASLPYSAMPSQPLLSGSELGLAADYCFGLVVALAADLRARKRAREPFPRNRGKASPRRHLFVSDDERAAALNA